MTGPPAEPDLESLARHGVAIATVRAFLDASGATRVVAVLDRPGEPGVMLACEPGAPLELTTPAGAVAIAPDATEDIPPLAVDAPLAPPPSALTVDPLAGEIHAPVGVVASLAEGVLALARALGGRSVASAEFATREPGTPLVLAAREGERVVAAAGDEQFEL